MKDFETDDKQHSSKFFKLNIGAGTHREVVGPFRSLDDIIIQLYSKRMLNPEDVMIFPWDGEARKDKQKNRTREEHGGTAKSILKKAELNKSLLFPGNP